MTAWLNLREEIADMFAQPNMWVELERLVRGRRKFDDWYRYWRNREQKAEAANASQCEGFTSTGKRCKRRALGNAVLCGIHVTR